MKYKVFIVNDATKKYQPIGTYDSPEKAQQVKSTYAKLYPEYNIIIDEEQTTTNSTDAMKKLVIERFAEPINEVEEAVDSLSKAINDLDRAQGVDDFILDRVIILRNKTNKLKEKLPTPQG